MSESSNNSGGLQPVMLDALAMPDLREIQTIDSVSRKVSATHKIGFLWQKGHFPYKWKVLFWYTLQSKC